MCFFSHDNELCRTNWQDNPTKNILISLLFPLKKLLISNNATMKYKQVRSYAKCQLDSFGSVSLTIS